MSVLENNNIKCLVKNCRFNQSHVTKGHLCGKCNKYGHGEIECYNIESILKLKQYYNDKLPENKWCKFGGCQFKEYHTSEAHHCQTCRGRFHSLETCPVNAIPKNIEVKCPLCKKDNVIPKSQNKIYGLADNCVVCLDHNVEIFLPNCGHVCLCYSCLKILDKNSITKPNCDPFMDIRSESVLVKENYDIAKIKSLLRDYPSVVYVYEGMGCCTAIRRLKPDDELFGLFIHSDDGYSPEKTEQNLNFIKGYYQVEDQTLFHNWNPHQ
jgi:hypothetical protein